MTCARSILQITQPKSFRCSNPSRVTPSQEPFVKFDLDQRYVPISVSSKPAGVVILKDKFPDEKDKVIAIKVPRVSGDEDAEPPEPFEWTPPDPEGAPATSSDSKISK